MLLGLMTCLVCSQSIAVTSPNGGESWQIGGPDKNITWTSSGLTTGTFKITIFNGSTNLGTIATGIACSNGGHSFNWQVGKLITGAIVSAGINYRIKIRQQGETPYDFSDGNFEIKGGVQIQLAPIVPTKTAKLPSRTSALPDFEIDTMLFHKAGNLLMLRVKNNTRVDYDGEVSIGIWINGTYLSPSRRERLFFKGNKTWDVQILGGDDFKGISGNTAIKVEVDSNGDVDETDEHNNSKTQSFNISPGPGFDLELTKITKHANPTLKGVVAHITNTGLNPVQRVSAKLYRNGRSIKECYITMNVQPGQTHIHSFHKVLIPGRNIIKMIIDNKNDIVESDENNNEKEEIFYPDIAGIEIVGNITIGIPGHTKIVTTAHNNVTITRDMTRPSSKSGYRAFEVKLMVRGLGTHQVSGYNIYILEDGRLSNYNLVRSGMPAQGALQHKTINVKSKIQNGVTKRVAIYLYPWDGKPLLNWTTLLNSFDRNLVIDSFYFNMEFQGF